MRFLNLIVAFFCTFAVAQNGVTWKDFANRSDYPCTDGKTYRFDGNPFEKEKATRETCQEFADAQEVEMEVLPDRFSKSKSFMPGCYEKTDGRVIWNPHNNPYKFSYRSKHRAYRAVCKLTPKAPSSGSSNSGGSDSARWTPEPQTYTDTADCGDDLDRRMFDPKTWNVIGCCPVGTAYMPDGTCKPKAEVSVGGSSSTRVSTQDYRVCVGSCLRKSVPEQSSCLVGCHVGSGSSSKSLRSVNRALKEALKAALN